MNSPSLVGEAFGSLHPRHVARERGPDARAAIGAGLLIQAPPITPVLMCLSLLHSKLSLLHGEQCGCHTCGASHVVIAVRCEAAMHQDNPAVIRCEDHGSSTAPAAASRDGWRRPKVLSSYVPEANQAQAAPKAVCDHSQGSYFPPNTFDIKIMS